MLGKIIIGLTAVGVVMVVPTMSASAQQTPAQKKGHGKHTKAGVQDRNRGHPELGAANRASVRASW
jgi:hypothetical protein